MIAGQLSITGTPGLKALRKRIANKRGALQVAGRAGRNTTVRHLRAFNRGHPNKLGGPRTNFYAKAADATSFAFVGDSAVEVSSSAIGLALRFHGTAGLPGGVLKPISGKYLTEPAAPEAHGKRAREFSDLEFGFALDPELGRMRPALVRESSGLADTPQRGSVEGLRYRADLPAGGDEPEAVFWLNRQARMKGDDSVLPTEDTIADEATEAVEDYLNILEERGTA